MTNQQRYLTAILLDHGIQWITQDGEILALSQCSIKGIEKMEWINIENLNVWHWLGY